MQKGQAAPSFSLYDTERNKISLTDFKGKPVVILFFPLAFTGVCTTELCGIRDDIANYNALDAQVIGISVDSTATLNQFKKEQQFNFPLLSDFNKDVSKAYDCFYEEYFFEMKGVSRRGAFVIDGNGIIQYREVLESAGDLPHFEAIKSVLSELKK